jgi:hypothetical protein
LTVRPLSRVQSSEVVGTSPVETAPDSVYTITEGASLLRRDAPVSLPRPLALTLFIAGPPLLWAAWLMSWRRRHPNLANQAKQRRSRAAGRALQALRNLKVPDESQEARATAAILAEYLREHLDFATQEPGPEEIASFLESLQLPPERIAKARIFFDHCLAARFGPGTPAGHEDWTTTAAELIEDWETRQPDPGREADTPLAFGTSAVIPALLAAALGAGLLGSRAFGDGLQTVPERGPAAELSADMEELLSRAAESFHQGVQLRGQPEEARQKFLAAAGAYAALQERGFQSAALARNTGNAYLLGGDLPRAILEYRQGLRLEPADSLLHANLAYARDQVAYPETNGFARPAEEFPLVSLLRASFRICLLATAAIYVVAWLALARWWTRRTTQASAVSVCAFFLTACFSLCVAFDVYKNRNETIHPVLVVAQDDVFLRKGNGFSYPPRSETPLNRGVEARLLHSRGNWLQIELASGEIGWIPKASALVSPLAPS